MRSQTRDKWLSEVSINISKPMLSTRFSSYPGWHAWQPTLNSSPGIGLGSPLPQCLWFLYNLAILATPALFLAYNYSKTSPIILLILWHHAPLLLSWCLFWHRISFQLRLALNPQTLEGWGCKCGLPYSQLPILSKPIVRGSKFKSRVTGGCWIFVEVRNFSGCLGFALGLEPERSQRSKYS